LNQVTDQTELLKQLIDAASIEEATTALFDIVGPDPEWQPLGRQNNRGAVEANADPGRSLVERVTNSIDGVLELEHLRHNGIPDCRSPREAAGAWLNVPEGGLAEMPQSKRQQLANRVVVRLFPGEGKERRIVEVRDRGVGIAPDKMESTILSLNETNKWTKHYLAGSYGQGGSSTFACSKLSLIVSRRYETKEIGYTIVQYLDLPADMYKTGHYVYLTIDGKIPRLNASDYDFDHGVLVRHFDYDLSQYGRTFAHGSPYGLLNEVLFDPVMPVWLEAKGLYNWKRRVIKGSRSALRGAIDKNDERRASDIEHHVDQFRTPISDFGRIGIEYWVLSAPTKKNRQPNSAYINPNRPIVLTINGQNHAQLRGSIIKKDAKLPFLAKRLVFHVECDSLTRDAKRSLFVSNREEARSGVVSDFFRLSARAASLSCTKFSSDLRTLTISEWIKARCERGESNEA
jgi:hypothetical protein